MGINLRIECFLDANPSLNPGLASLDLSHDLLDILQLVTALPEYSCGQQKKEEIYFKSFSLVWLWNKLFKNVVTRIFHDFLWSFPLDFSGDVLNIVPPPLLVRFDELVEVTFVPDCKTL